MKTLFILLSFFVFTSFIFGQAFLVPTDTTYSPLRIKNHRVEVTISNGAAQTKVKQTFINSYNYDIEATYIFPLPNGASVSKFKMKMNGSWVEGKVLEKNEAKNIYENIVRQMKDPGLIEYMGNNMFKARVYPVPKNGEMELEMTYTQVMDFSGDIYSYVYPLKNSSSLSTNTQDDFTFTAKISSVTPIKSIYSPSHKMDIIKKDNEATAGFELTKGNLKEDVKLFYTVSRKDIGASMISFKDKEDKKGYFMIMMAPKSEGDDKEIENKNLLLVVDTSGSMAGDKIVYAKKSLEYVVKRLNNKDKFNIIRFSSGVETFKKESVVANEDNKKEALKFIDDIVASGGTAIDEAMQEALKKLDKDLTNLIVFITDGKPTVGETEPKEILKNIEKNKKGDVNIFSFGIGDDLDAMLIDKIAEKNNGSSDYMKGGSEIEVVLSNFYDRVAYPVLMNAQLEIKGAKTFDIFPYKMPSLFRGQQLSIFGRYESEDGKSVLLRLTGEKKGSKKTYDFEVDIKPQETYDFIPHIWATQKVGFLLDAIRMNGENKELVDEVTLLGKQFGIVTPYTSYLVTEPNTVTNNNNNNWGNNQIDDSLGSGDGGGWRRGTTASESKADMDEESAGFADKEMMKAESGSVAVKTSKKLKDMKESEQVSNTSYKKSIGSKTFMLKSGVWVDTAFDSKTAKKTISVKYFSKNYLELVKNKELKKYLSLGENIDIYFNGYKIEIRSDVSESDLPKDLTK